MIADEIQKANERDLIAKLDYGEAVVSGALAQKLQAPAVQLNDNERQLLAPFVDWCNLHGVRKCAAKPLSVSIAHDVVVRLWFGRPWWWEAALTHHGTY